jgi:glycosyltransferase involved in cell wall biosynthesis
MIRLIYIFDKIGRLNKLDTSLFLVKTESDIDMVVNAAQLLKTKCIVCSTDQETLEKSWEKLGGNIDRYLLVDEDDGIYEVQMGDQGISGKQLKAGLDQADVLFFGKDSTMEELILLKQSQPKIVLGDLQLYTLDYYEVWQHYRQIADHIFLTVLTKEGKPEVVDWTRDESNNIELSIVLPIYNVGKYLEACIESLTQWNADYFEIIAVNDGSTDNSLEILNRLAQNDKRIRVITKENGGCASARKKGMELARGRYIGFVDPDDFTTPDMFYLLHRRALLGGYEVAYCGYNEYYETTKKHLPIISDNLYHPYNLGTINPKEIRNLIITSQIAIWRCIYKAEFLKREGITFKEDIRRFDDLPFKFEVLAKARSVVSLIDFMYFYRLERPGQDISANDDRLFVHFAIFKHLDDLVKELGEAEITDLLQITKINTHLWALSKLQEKFKREYKKGVKKDLKTNMGIIRSALVALRYRDKKFMMKSLLLSLGFING